MCNVYITIHIYKPLVHCFFINGFAFYFIIFRRNLISSASIEFYS